MADEDKDSRTEQASGKRREDFRKKGQVAQSREVHTAALMTAFLLLWLFYAPIFWEQLELLMRGLISQIGTFQLSPASVRTLFIFILARLGLLLSPLLLLVLVIGFFSSFMQIGWLFTTKPLEPDLSKLDPIKGAAKFFSKRSLLEVAKSLAKVLLIGYVAYRTIHGEFEQGLNLIDMPPASTLIFIGRMAFAVLLKTCGILIVLGLIDYLFVRWEMEEKMKMTKQEQKEEYKEMEGDPLIKGKIRQIQMQMARKRMMAEIPKADVVITNPTHLSVAIAYRREEMDSPRIVAKGADALAMKIREIAKEHGVPLVENVPVARALYKFEVGDSVPEELYKAVAEILAYVYSLKGKAKQ
jgi:flagellar biosynthetic protein FlhB